MLPQVVQNTGKVLLLRNDWRQHEGKLDWTYPGGVVNGQRDGQVARTVHITHGLQSLASVPLCLRGGRKVVVKHMRLVHGHQDAFIQMCLSR